MGKGVFWCIFVKWCFAFSIYEVQSPKQSQLITRTGSHLSKEWTPESVHALIGRLEFINMDVSEVYD